MIPPDLAIDLWLHDRFGIWLADVLRDALLGRRNPALADELLVTLDRQPVSSFNPKGMNGIKTVRTGTLSFTEDTCEPVGAGISERFRFQVEVLGDIDRGGKLAILLFVPSHWPQSSTEWPDEW